MAKARRRAIWRAKCTVSANNADHHPFRDSEASRWRSDAVAAERRKAVKARSKTAGVINKFASVKTEMVEGPVHLGGRTLGRNQQSRLEEWLAVQGVQSYVGKSRKTSPADALGGKIMQVGVKVELRLMFPRLARPSTTR